MAEAGYAFDVDAPNIDEEAFALIVADQHRLPTRLAEAKADAVVRRYVNQKVVILAADTVVYSAAAEVLGKPRDRADAQRMLRTLAGTLHWVVTGLCCHRCIDNRRESLQVRSAVVMRTLTEAEMSAYLDTGAWDGKAGGYGIQDEPTGQGQAADNPFVRNIEGELTNVVGLPMPQVVEVLERLGVVRDL